jgi:predicted DNA-binding transcriptional regulator AlpA
MQASERLVGISLVAALAGVSPAALRKWEAAGLIPAARRLESGRPARVWLEGEVDAIREVAQMRKERSRNVGGK